MEITETKEPIASFSSRSFLKGGLVSNIAIVTFISLLVMSLLINLDLPIWITVGAFMLTIYVLIQMRSGKVRYDLFEWGFTQHLTPMFNKKRRIERRFTWDDVKSYQVGIDMNRRKQEYNYLNLRLKKTPDHIQMHDADSDMQYFLQFRDAFVKQLEGYNASYTEAPTVASRDEKRKIGPIKRKPDFYKTFWAKLITLLLVVFTLVMLGYVILNRGNVSYTNLFRIFVIIIPGTAYMLYRVFWRNGN